MSSATTPHLPPTQNAPVVPPPTAYENLIDSKLRKTQRRVKSVDIAAATLNLGIGVLAYLLVAAVVDHWLVYGGLGFWGRFWLWAVLLSAASVYCLHRLLPPVVRRINPIYAAATIEQSRPTLKNSLINFLLLRGHRQEIAPPVYQAMERRAAADLSDITVDLAVDRANVIRRAIILAVLVALGCLYLAISPKNPLRSAARVLWPWSNVAAPTRATINDPQPGNVSVFNGDFVTISAEIAGLLPDEQAAVIYSSADGQTVEQLVPMTVPTGEYRYQCRLPPGNTGCQQDYTYRIAAGDCRTPLYRITVQLAPAIVVQKVTYQYPAYTGIAPLTVVRQGDLRAIEGTEVSIEAAANTDIKPGSAEIDLGCTGRQGRQMSIEGRTAIGQFTLRMDAQNPDRPEYNSYQIRFADLQGRENRLPIRHSIAVLRDMPPEVQILQPQQEDIQLSLNDALTIKVRAEDPDFGLRRVVLRAERAGRSLAIGPLLEIRKPRPARPGEFIAEYSFRPTQLGLAAGDRVEYWAEAHDNKEPEAGKSSTTKRWITIIAPGSTREQSGDRDRPDAANGDRRTRPEDRQPGEGPLQADQRGDDGHPDRQPADGQQPGEQSASENDAQPDSDRSEQHQADQADSSEGRHEGQSAKGSGQQSDQQQLAQASDRENNRIDPEAEPGDAIQRILEDRQQQQQEKGEGQKPESKPQPPQSKQPGEKSSAKQPQEKQPNGQEPSGQQPRDGRTADQPTGPADNREQTDQPQTADQQSSEDQPGEQQSGEQQSTDEKAGEKSSGQQTDEQQAANGDSSSDQQKSGEQQQGHKPSPGDAEDQSRQSGSPMPQGENRTRDKQSHQPDARTQPNDGQRPESPSGSRHQSDSRGDTEGDRSGGGPQGGGQQANQSGAGQPGSHTAADEGGDLADQSGNGDLGSRPDDQATSKTPTGSSHKTPGDMTAGRPSAAETDKRQTDDDATPEGRAFEKTTEGKPTDQAHPDAKQSGEQSGAEGSAPTPAGQQQPQGGSPSEGDAKRPDRFCSDQPTVGGQPGTKTDQAAPPPADSLADQANLEYARRQTELALEHLRDQLAKEKPELLEKLGWTKDDARRFLSRWEEMKRQATEGGSAADAARRQFNEALQSLGLQPRGAELKRGGVIDPRRQTLRDAGRFAPPPEWAEQFREYTRGVAGQKSD